MEEIVRLHLQAALAGVAVDWGLSPQGADAPRVVLYRIGITGDIIAEGDSGLRRARVQADCFGVTYRAARDLAQAAITALNGWRDGNKILGVFLDAVRDLPPETGTAATLGRVSVDFFVNYQEF